MFLSPVRTFFAAAPHIARLPAAEIARQYPRYRWRVLEATFLGYGTFYVVRNNYSVVAKDIEGALHYTDSMTGSILAITAMTYGVGKFLMGSVSDRSNPRTFMTFGLLMTALCNFAFGSIADYHVHLALWAINGFFQGMGWPPCGRSMGHWFSERERGLTFSIWNTSHNVGGGLAGILAAWVAKNLGGWQYAFFVPGVLALIGAVYIFLRLCDTPQSVGLPSIEEYKSDFTEQEKLHGTVERELTTRELFVEHVLLNKYIWLLAIANFFAYVTRYSMLDWGPKYLREVKNATLMGGGLGILVTEFGGIPSTILLGWISDLAGGRRGLVAALSLVPLLGVFTTIMLTPAGHLWLDMTMLAAVGFFVYPVINLIVIQALDLTSKKAIGTAAGFIGLVGYAGKTAQAQGFGWILEHFGQIYGRPVAWKIVICAILGCTVMGIVLLAFTWRLRPKA